MAKSYAIECPHCGNMNHASGFILAKRTIKCSCGKDFSVKENRLSSCKCASCGNETVYDQKKADKTICPVCKKPLLPTESRKTITGINCPKCASGIIVDKSAASYICPLCDENVDVQKEIKRAELVKDGKVSIIQLNMSKDSLVQRHPTQDFNMGSQLIVDESQEAVFYYRGQALDLFGPGNYALDTQKLPMLSKVYTLPTTPDGVELFKSHVYFVNLTTRMGIKWGAGEIGFRDANMGNIPLTIGASGNFSLKVTDSRKLLVKLIGTESEFNASADIDKENNADEFMKRFRPLVTSAVKNVMASAIKENEIDLFEIAIHYEKLGEALRERVNTVLDDYGLIIPVREFFVENVALPENDPNFQKAKQQHADMYLKIKEEEVLRKEAEAAMQRKLVEAETAAKIRAIEAGGEAEALRVMAQAEAQEMQMKGYTYAQETQRQVGVGAVTNSGGAGGAITGGGGGQGGMLGDIVTLGVGLGAMGSVLDMTKGAMAPMKDMGGAVGGMVGGNWNCECGNVNITGNFCNNCGKQKPVPAVPDIWDCECGNRGVNGKFCSNCGKPKPQAPLTWTCACGNAGITGKFCGECGKPQAATAAEGGTEE